MMPVFREKRVWLQWIWGPMLSGGARNSMKLTVSLKSPPRIMPTAVIGSSRIGKRNILPGEVGVGGAGGVWVFTVPVPPASRFSLSIMSASDAPAPLLYQGVTAG